MWVQNPLIQLACFSNSLSWEPQINPDLPWIFVTPGFSNIHYPCQHTWKYIYLLMCIKSSSHRRNWALKVLRVWLIFWKETQILHMKSFRGTLYCLVFTPALLSHPMVHHHALPYCCDAVYYTSVWWFLCISTTLQILASAWICTSCVQIEKKSVDGIPQ